MLLMQDPQAAAARRAGRRHDRRGDRAHRRAVPRRSTGKHSLVVVEHDMEFVHAHASATGKGDRAARGQRAGRGLAGRGAGERERDRGLSWTYGTSAALERCAPTRGHGVLAGVAQGRRLNQYYGGSHILRDVALRGRGGRGARSLLGRNGVGKTTLLKSLMGLVPVRSGSDPLRRRRHHARRRRTSACARGIGYVPQGREIFARLTVEENLRMGLAYKRGRHARCRPSCSSCSRCSKQMLHRRGGDLSGGQQQQLAIARALAAGPQLLDPRRADRGHPAVDHQGHRPRHPHARRHGLRSTAAQRWRSCWSSSTTTSPPSSPTTTW